MCGGGVIGADGVAPGAGPAVYAHLGPSHNRLGCESSDLVQLGANALLLCHNGCHTCSQSGSLAGQRRHTTTIDAHDLQGYGVRRTSAHAHSTHPTTHAVHDSDLKLHCCCLMRLTQPPVHRAAPPWSLFCCHVTTRVLPRWRSHSSLAATHGWRCCCGCSSSHPVCARCSCCRSQRPANDLPLPPSTWRLHAVARPACAAAARRRRAATTTATRCCWYGRQLVAHHARVADSC
jgi:hypothetical protein